MSARLVRGLIESLDEISVLLWNSDDVFRHDVYFVWAVLAREALQCPALFTVRSPSANNFTAGR